ncbi:hypothetical protein [Legionella hackeliae]|uniref:hypothetical protein n=1 Tax=Legionella hackeliae TaxID=449 RepID=UPI000E20C816|nr:hypothetical protein [Legionella hackeliae]
MEQISTDHLLKVACDIEIKLSSAEEEYESEIDDLEIDAFNRESNLSIADMKKEDGFAEYLVAYDKITGDHHVELINLQSKIRMNPQDRSVLEKQETLRDQKEQALEALHKKTPNATRFYSLAKNNPSRNENKRITLRKDDCRDQPGCSSRWMYLSCIAFIFRL